MKLTRVGRRLHRKLWTLILRAYPLLSLPATTFFLFSTARVRPEYGLTWGKAFRLALRMYRNTRKVETGTSYRAHLAMTAKLLEIPRTVDGDVIECGCFRGGSTVNLSLACELVDRQLIVYDSFEGFPPAQPGDRYGGNPGAFRADLEEVRENVRSYGRLDRCTFRKGFFGDTLPNHDRPIVLCFLDVDMQGSLWDCVVNLWPHLTDRGFMFIDEYTLLDYSALFFSERFWRERFDRPPPGLIGAGSGVALGQHYLGPLSEDNWYLSEGVAYTRKDFRGDWTFYPEEGAADATPVGAAEEG